MRMLDMSTIPFHMVASVHAEMGFKWNQARLKFKVHKVHMVRIIWKSTW